MKRSELKKLIREVLEEASSGAWRTQYPKWVVRAVDDIAMMLQGQKTWPNEVLEEIAAAIYVNVNRMSETATTECVHCGCNDPTHSHQKKVKELGGMVTGLKNRVMNEKGS